MPMTPIVRNYLTVLTSKLVEHDQRESARESKRGRANIYRMGLLLEAANLVSQDMKDREEDGGPEAMAGLRRSLGRRFDPDFPPIRSLIKLIDSNPRELTYGPGQKAARKPSKKQLDGEIESYLKNS